MPSVFNVCIKTASLVVCFVLLRIANKLLLDASKDHKTTGLDTVFTVSRIGVFVHCLLCASELCGIALTHISEPEGTFHWIYDDNTNNTIVNEENQHDVQHGTSHHVVARQLQFIWWWSYHTNMLYTRQIYTYHSKRVHTSMLMLYYHTAHFFSRNQSDERGLGQPATSH